MKQKVSEAGVLERGGQKLAPESVPETGPTIWVKNLKNKQENSNLNRGRGPTKIESDLPECAPVVASF